MPFRLEFFAIITITEREHQAIKLDDHTQPLAFSITHWVASGKGIANAILAVIFCWRTNSMTAENMA
jgi:hypothetical protein